MEAQIDTIRLPRSSLWPALRKAWLRDHPTCAACGSAEDVEVHHKVPVHVNRSLELKAENLITLCESSKHLPTGKDKYEHTCHLRIGHLGNWFNWNKNVELDSKKALLLKYDEQHVLHQQPQYHPVQTRPGVPSPSYTPQELAVETATSEGTPNAADLLKTAPYKNPAAAAPGDARDTGPLKLSVRRNRKRL